MSDVSKDIDFLTRQYQYGDTVSTEFPKNVVNWYWVMGVSEGGRLICRSKGLKADVYIQVEDVKEHVKRAEPSNIGALNPIPFRNPDPVPLKFCTSRD